MIRKVDHIGIAVRELESSVSHWVNCLGYSLEGVESVHERDVRVAFLSLEGSPPVELITPLKEGTAVARFLEKRGEGIHHICYEVGDILAAVRSLKGSGVELVGEEPGAGAGGAKTIFLHPRSFNGVLIELKQKQA